MNRNRLIASIVFVCVLYIGCWMVAFAQPTFTVTLRWTAPTENTDGSPLTNLVGYRVYYGKSEAEVRAKANRIDIDDAAVVQHVMTQNELAANTLYFFGVTAVNSYRVESALSNIAQKLTPSTAVPSPPTNVLVEIVFNTE